jgi:hypothetical protein
MRKKQISSALSQSAALLFALGVMLLPLAAQAKNVSKTAMAGAYTVNLKVLPAESFSGPHAEMVKDAGAKPDLLNSSAHPNHHLVAFLRKNGKPVEQATVAIRYRELSPKQGNWMSLPVVRMHVKGKGLATTHYGNNLRIAPGSYEVQVTVDGSGPATFHFTLR